MDVDTNSADRDRWMSWAGLAFLLLFFTAMVLSGEDVGEKLSGKEVLDAVGDREDQVLLSAMVAPLAAAALLLFAARLRSLVGRAGAAKHLLLGGAIVYAISLAFTAVTDLALAGASRNHHEAAATALNLLDNATWLPITMGAGLTLIGAGLAVLRTLVLPAWMGWIAVVGGVISLIGPGGFLGFFLGPLWIAVAGVMLAVRKETAVVSQASPAPGAPFA